MDIKEKITEWVEEAVAKLKASPDLLKNFKDEPIKTLEKLIGKDLPDEQIENVINLIKAKLAGDELKDKADDLKDKADDLKDKADDLKDDLKDKADDLKGALKGIGKLFGK